jgi:hypothetical protein
MATAVTTDLQALNYIFNAPEFEKPYSQRKFLGEFAGKGWPNFLSTCGVRFTVVLGLLFVEGTSI